MADEAGPLAQASGGPAKDFPGRTLLHTRRLYLREFCARDVPELLRLGREPRVSALLLDHPMSTLVEVCGFVAWINDIYTRPECVGIWRAATAGDVFRGFFSLMPETGTSDIGLGARLLPGGWGRGYSLEGGAAMCGHAFDALKLPRLIGLCAPDNRSVPPLLLRLGFRPDGEITQDAKPALRFVLQRDEWSGIRRRARQSPDV